MAKKTNKTSHVLNLITNGTPSEPESENPPSLAQEPEQEKTGPGNTSGQASMEAVVMREADATKEHAAALRENAAALRESAAAIREAVGPLEEGEARMEGEVPTEVKIPVMDQTPSEGPFPAEGQIFSERPLPSEAPPLPGAGELTGSEEMSGYPDKVVEAAVLAAEPEKPLAQQETSSDITERPVKEPSMRPVTSGEKTVIVVNKSGENDKLSNEILNQLTSHLEEETKIKQEVKERQEAQEKQKIQETQEPVEKQESIEEQESAEKQGAMEEQESAEKQEAEEKQEATEKQESTVMPEAMEAQGSMEQQESGEQHEVYRMVNVMEQIMEHTDLEKQMRTYDVCMCSRCRVDVKALILTRLPAKYVVVDESSVAPIIGYYENKFKVRVLTEVIKACMDVKEKPRHGRPEIL